ncbi:unnamed protein product [Coregonus sp. 'balchen']|nr:unnamed protein product [Coregonus sp. 'balchen']
MGPPRTVLIRFLRSTARDKVLQAAKEKGDVQWEDRWLSFFLDLSKELAMKRKKFATAKKQLHKKNVRHTLAFPATLLFTWKGKKKIFKDNMEAERFLLEQDV